MSKRYGVLAIASKNVHEKAIDKNMAINHSLFMCDNCLYVRIYGLFI